MDFRTFGILPAAGTGLRTTLPLPKQFCLVAGRPLISYTLERFQNLPWMEGIYVSIAEDWRDYMETLISQCKLTKIRLVAGSTTRHRSIKNCMEALDRKLGTENQGDEEEKVVIVHDAVRPFVDEGTLRQIAVAARQQGACGAMRPLVSTIIASDENNILDHSLVRSKYRESHTPQAFTYSVIKAAYQKMTEHDLDYGTECLHLALEYTGTKAKLLEAPDEVWKVTYKKDFLAAEVIAIEKFSLVGLVTDDSTDFTKQLQLALKEKNLQVGAISTEMSKLPKETNLIIIHKVTPGIDSISTCCNQAIEFLQQHSSYGGVITCIMSGVDLNKTWHQVHHLAQQITVDLKQTLVYFVIIGHKDKVEEDSSRLTKASKMAADLLYNRNQHLNGQVLVV